MNQKLLNTYMILLKIKSLCLLMSSTHTQLSERFTYQNNLVQTSVRINEVSLY